MKRQGIENKHEKCMILKGKYPIFVRKWTNYYIFENPEPSIITSDNPGGGGVYDLFKKYFGHLKDSAES